MPDKKRLVQFLHIAAEHFRSFFQAILLLQTHTDDAIGDTRFGCVMEIKVIARFGLGTADGIVCRDKQGPASGISNQMIFKGTGGGQA